MDKGKMLALAVLVLFIIPVAFAQPSSLKDKPTPGWMKRISSWSQGIISWSQRFKPKPAAAENASLKFSGGQAENDSLNGPNWGQSKNCSWINVTTNCSWLNVTTNCSWLNITTNCSWINTTTNCSWLNTTTNCTWINTTINGSVVSVPTNCSWINVTTNCSWLNTTTNCSWLNTTTNCSWLNTTVNCSWSNTTVCSGGGPAYNDSRGFSSYTPRLIHMGLGITGTENFSEFHIVKLRVIRARKVSPQEIRQLIAEDMPYESIIDYLRSRAIAYWGTMNIGQQAYTFEATFEEDGMSGTLYESIPKNMLTHAMVGRFEPEVSGNFTLTKEIHEGDELWRGVINVGDESYINTFIFSQLTARWLTPAANRK